MQDHDEEEERQKGRMGGLMDRIKRKAAEAAEQKKVEAAGAVRDLAMKDHGGHGLRRSSAVHVVPGKSKRDRRRRSIVIHGRFQLPESTVLRVIARSGPVRVWMPHGKSHQEVEEEAQTRAAIRMQKVFRGRQAKREK